MTVPGLFHRGDWASRDSSGREVIKITTATREKQRSDGDFEKDDMVYLWTFLLQGAVGAESLYRFKGESPSSWERNPLCITKTSEIISCSYPLTLLPTPSCSSVRCL